MGCLRFIVSLTIMVFAIIGLNSVGLLDYVKNKVNEYINPPQAAVVENAARIADISNMPESFELVKTYDLAGVKGIIANHKQSDQKMVLFDPAWALKISQDDIESGNIESKIKDLTSKISMGPVSINAIEVIKKGHFKINGEKTPYLKVKLNLSGAKKENIEAFVVVTKNNKVALSINEEGQLNTVLASNFFNSVTMK